MELFFIWIPILYHGLYGIWIWWRGDSNVSDYPWQGNWFYTSQRWTGIIAFIYIVQHTYYLRFTGVHLPTHPMQSFAKVQGEFQNPWMIAFYAVGIIAASWHFGYGIWLFCAKWGITTGEVARRRLGYIVLLIALGSDQPGRGQYVRIHKHSASDSGSGCSREHRDAVMSFKNIIRRGSNMFGWRSALALR